MPQREHSYDDEECNEPYNQRGRASIALRCCQLALGVGMSMNNATYGMNPSVFHFNPILTVKSLTIQHPNIPIFYQCPECFLSHVGLEYPLSTSGAVNSRITLPFPAIFRPLLPLPGIISLIMVIDETIKFSGYAADDHLFLRDCSYKTVDKVSVVIYHLFDGLAHFRILHVGTVKFEKHEIRSILCIWFPNTAVRSVGVGELGEVGPGCDHFL